ncbi:colanic acid biosynthesis glycosyltransferase WcaL [Pseudoalteromonas sp. CO302Y]|uniref:glycosyltransferase n=1 Tax=unclassified Pseudoalteromonas TaxID=194690 RepID=UPI001023E641|nr:colanic acid biosynthesis glycosyltransferase WcaL [Pseudoalteromonas sp. CO302Y]RZG10778.1 colanic acid biosynthesis glycosyltransferase WcaL [Pseudoalteromonas sp. CO133X]
MKHIAILVPSFPIASETFVVTEIKALLNTGHKVTVFTFEKTSVLINLSCAIEVKVILKPAFKLILPAALNISKLAKATYTAAQFKSISTQSLLAYGYQIARYIKAAKIEHLHCHFMHGPLAYGIVAAKIADITVSSIGHGHDVYVNNADLKPKLALCDFSIAVCEEMAMQFKRFSKSNVKLLHCGIDTSQFKFAPSSLNESVRLIFIGRLVEKKGLQFLLPALKHIPKEFGITLDIIGDGPMLNDLMYMAEELGIRKSIRFLGEKPHDWVSSNLIYYSALIAPFCVAENGDRDTGPLVLKEAMACGLPVLTTTLMGANEIVTPSVGMKCMPSSISGLSKMLYKFHQLSPHKRYLLGQNAKQHVNEHYNAVKQAQQLSKWVESL